MMKKETDLSRWEIAIVVLLNTALAKTLLLGSTDFEIRALRVHSGPPYRADNERLTCSLFAEGYVDCPRGIGLHFMANTLLEVDTFTNPQSATSQYPWVPKGELLVRVDERQDHVLIGRMEVEKSRYGFKVGSATHSVAEREYT